MHENIGAVHINISFEDPHTQLQKLNTTALKLYFLSMKMYDFKIDENKVIIQQYGTKHIPSM